MKYTLDDFMALTKRRNGRFVNVFYYNKCQTAKLVDCREAFDECVIIKEGPTKEVMDFALDYIMSNNDVVINDGLFCRLLSWVGIDLKEEK